MEVQYDARGDASLQDALRTHPKLNEALRVCNVNFIISLEEEDLQNGPRLCFELQEAFWYYTDFLYENDKQELPKLNQNTFIALMINWSDVLRMSHPDTKKLIKEWREYCKSVPLRGAILISKSLEKCLLVQGWKGNKWSFPRGKANEDEREEETAAREVFEEVGINIRDLIVADDYVQAELPCSSQPVKLFVVGGISEDMKFEPNTRKEIAKIAWVPLDRLPGWSEDDVAPPKINTEGVEPFLWDLWYWVKAKKKAERARSRQQTRRQQAARAPEHGAAAATTCSAEQAGASGKVDAAKIPESRGQPRKCDDGASAALPAEPALETGLESALPTPPMFSGGHFYFDMGRVRAAFDKGWDGAARAAANAAAEAREGQAWQRSSGREWMRRQASPSAAS